MAVSLFTGNRQAAGPAPGAAVSAAPVSRSISTGNEAHDRLASLPERDQATVLGNIVNEGCAGNRAFYMGSSPTDRSAFWSVGCKNGENYLVSIDADAAGSTTVLDCRVYKAVAKMNCFRKIEK
jgi:hypothetical protein